MPVEQFRAQKVARRAGQLIVAENSIVGRRPRVPTSVVSGRCGRIDVKGTTGAGKLDLSPKLGISALCDIANACQVGLISQSSPARGLHMLNSVAPDWLPLLRKRSCRSRVAWMNCMPPITPRSAARNHE
jgi:hypothetical protein